jgi:hypothetical protein
VPRSTLYLRRRPDESFADAMADALETGTDLLENEALRRAKEGVDEPVSMRARSAATSANTRTRC